MMDVMGGPLVAIVCMLLIYFLYTSQLEIVVLWRVVDPIRLLPIALIVFGSIRLIMALIALVRLGWRFVTGRWHEFT